MKLNFYGFSVERHSTGDRYIFDINPFLRAYSQLEAPEYKNSFTHGDENLYLINLEHNIYLYVMSKSNEIVKKIRESDQSVSGIQELLAENEKLGFASYVCIGDGFIGFASTILAPKAVSFGHFMNELLETLGFDDYKFIMRPLVHEASRGEANDMIFMGKTTIEINSRNPAHATLREYFGCTPEDFQNVDTIEISLKPKFRKDIKPAVRKVLNNMPTDGVERFMIKAKESLADQLSDIFVTGQGAVSSIIKKGTDYEICGNMRTAVNDNQLLREKLNEHRQGNNIQFLAPQDIAAIDSGIAWSNRLVQLQSDS